MNKLYISDLQEVADKIKKIKQESVGATIAVIGEYQYTKEIVKYLICMGYDIQCVEIESPEIDFYDSEFIVSLDENNDVWCERAKRDTYILDFSDYTFFIDCAYNDALVSRTGNHEGNGCTYDVRFVCPSQEDKHFEFDDFDVAKVREGFEALEKYLNIIRELKVHKKDEP